MDRKLCCSPALVNRSMDHQENATLQADIATAGSVSSPEIEVLISPDPHK